MSRVWKRGRWTETPPQVDRDIKSSMVTQLSQSSYEGPTYHHGYRCAQTHAQTLHVPSLSSRPPQSTTSLVSFASGLVRIERVGLTEAICCALG